MCAPMSSGCVPKLQQGNSSVLFDQLPPLWQVWYAADTAQLAVVAQQEPSTGNKKNNLFPTTSRMIWRHLCVIWSCFPPSLSHSFPLTRNSHTQLTGQSKKKKKPPLLAEEEFVLLWEHRGPIWKNAAAFSVPAWLIPSCIWSTQ